MTRELARNGFRFLLFVCLFAGVARRLKQYQSPKRFILLHTSLPSSFNIPSSKSGKLLHRFVQDSMFIHFNMVQIEYEKA